MTNLHVGTYVIHASMHLQLYISENSPFDSSKAVKKTSFISGWLLQKANKGISSYKLSASQDPKLHAESHSHFGRKDVMLQ
jgi:CRISPR/Cas system CSM-associated protein Csm4 (group 5 of RAMP superfamily)